VVSYSGARARAHEARVSYAPVNRYRWEFLTPAGAVERVAVSDGTREELRVPGRAAVLIGDAVGGAPTGLEDGAERRLFLSNYSLESAGAGDVAGRACWRLRVSPRVKGKPSQELWVDRATGVVLESRRFHPEGTRASVSRYHSFVPGTVPDADFELSGAAEGAARHGLEPTDEASDAVLKELPPALAKVRQLPFGFAFDGADRLRVGGRTVRHLRWTDGLVSVSLFVSDRPARLTGARVEGASLRPVDADPGPGRVLSWKSGKTYYTLMGDLTEPLLKALQARLKS
jgi:negative regulator of sigma E activity